MKSLTELSIEEYIFYNKLGMLYEFFPEATGSYKEDVEKKRNESTN